MGRKRGSGEGSIAKRPNGTWYGRYTVHLPDGTPKRRSVYGKTRREVAEEMTRHLRDAHMGLVAQDDKQPLSEYLAHWLDTTARASVRERTFESYEIAVRLHINPALGTVPLAELRPQHIQTFLREMVEKHGKSEGTALRTYAVLKRALEQAVRWNLILRNAAALVDAPRQHTSEMLVFTKEQAHALLAHVKGDRLEAYYTVAMSLGLRLGEALGLHWQDVDFTRGTITILYSLQRANGKLNLYETKNRTSNRTIKMPQLIRDALQQHQARQDAEREALGSKWQESGFVFTTGKGTPIDPRNMARLYKRHLRALELPDFRVHDMRHTAASLMLAQGVPLKMVSEILGHSSSRVTLDIYAHVYEEGRQQAADKIDDIFPQSRLA
jgi:integrase